jgi:hypothetical protein
MAARNPVIAKGLRSLQGGRWPEIGEVIILRREVSVVAGIVQGYTSDKIIVKYGTGLWLVDTWRTDVYALQTLVDMLPSSSDEPGHLFRNIMNSAQFMPENFSLTYNIPHEWRE